MDFWTIFLIGVVVILWGIIFRRKKNPKLPPSPPALPIVGHLLGLGTEPWKKFLEWKKIYGPIITVQFGSVQAVVLQDETVIRQAFNQITFSDRPRAQFFKDISQGHKGLIFAHAEDALEQRHFLMRNLRDLGYGRKSMEEKITDEVEEFIEKLQVDSNCSVDGEEKMKDKLLKPIQMKHRFTNSVVNSFASIFISRRFPIGDPKFQAFDHSVKTALTTPGFLGEMALFFPWLAHVLKWLAKISPIFSGLKMKKEAYAAVYKFTQDEIDRHAQTRVKDQPRDFIDAYLDKVESTTDPKSSFHESRKFGARLVGDILLGAFDTTSVALEWLTLYLIRHPQIQQRLYEDIIRVTGNSRLTCLNDRPSMNFTSAVIFELLRVTSFVPFGVFHGTSEDVVLEGHFIPGGTLIYPNLYGVHLDPETWESPKEFKPDRFLDDEGRLKKFDAYLPFISGRRVCPVLIYRMSKFKIESWNANEMPTLEWIPGIICSPQEFHARVTLRG